MFDVAIVGGGIAGMATAARLQAAGFSTIVFESHGQPGGCAGFFRRHGFAFDVGATTLVDFESGGVGGELLDSIGMPMPPGELLPGYAAWLPDRMVTLYRDTARWHQERLQTLGDSGAHRRFWNLIDRLAATFWRASRVGIKMPIQGINDFLRAVRCVGPMGVPLVRFLGWTMGDALRRYGLRGDAVLVGLLSMLLEDTVHATVDDAPLINGALGITIRGAGLTRVRGGMFGFWKRFVAHYRSLGGILRVGCPVGRIERLNRGSYRVHARRGTVDAGQVVSAVPIALTSKLAPPEVGAKLRPYLERDAQRVGGAIVVFLGVPESEVATHAFRHHQLLHEYGRPLGDGNNMFISVSAPGDTDSAPPGYRCVMISTHCNLESWEGLGSGEYEEKKAHAGRRLLALARRVYPELGQGAIIQEFATPRTYERFTRRLRGAVGGVRQCLGNVNQRAVPHDIGLPGFWLAGDTTWPGLGTVACVLGSRIVAEAVRAAAPRRSHITRCSSNMIQARRSGAEECNERIAACR